MYVGLGGGVSTGSGVLGMRTGILLTVAPVDFSPLLSARNLLRLKEHRLSQLGSLRLRSCQDPKGDWAQLCEIQLAQVQA